MDTLERIQIFLRKTVPASSPVVVFLSGGVDSDVVARIAVATFGAARVAGITCLQDDQEPQHPRQAAALATALGIEYAQVDLGRMPATLAGVLARASPQFDDGENTWLLEARSKCALRTSVAALYHDRGYFLLGCGNRTELRMGFFMPLGDGISHVAPILHLFKTEVYELAKILGTAADVVGQPASAGFWVGQSDLEDICYWMLHGGPIVRPVNFSKEQIAEVRRMQSLLSFAALDTTLRKFESGAPVTAAASASGLELPMIERIYRVSETARKLKVIPKGISLLEEEST